MLVDNASPLTWCFLSVFNFFVDLCMRFWLASSSSALSSLTPGSDDDLSITCHTHTHTHVDHLLQDVTSSIQLSHQSCCCCQQCWSLVLYKVVHYRLKVNRNSNWSLTRISLMVRGQKRIFESNPIPLPEILTWRSWRNQRKLTDVGSREKMADKITWSN